MRKPVSRYRKGSYLPEVPWAEIKEAGAYAELASGDLYRIPKEALVAGVSPIIVRESRESSRMVQVSRNPFVSTWEARLRCAQRSIPPHF